MAKARTAANDLTKRSPSTADTTQKSNASHERPQELPLNLIEEDPFQPRTVFDKQLLEGLAQTIRQRGVESDIGASSSRETRTLHH